MIRDEIDTIQSKHLHGYNNVPTQIKQAKANVMS